MDRQGTRIGHKKDSYALRSLGSVRTIQIGETKQICVRDYLKDKIYYNNLTKLTIWKYVH